MLSRTITQSVLAAVFTVAITGGAAHGALLLDFTGGSANGGVPFQSVWGWTFTLNQSATVSAVGVFDVGGDGIDGYDVGVWDNGFNPPLASTHVNDGNSYVVASASGMGVWRMRDVDDFVLGPGTYTLGAFYPDGGQTAIVHQATATMADGAIFFASQSFTNASGLAFPGSTAGDEDGKFGPNLYLVTVIPEPAAFTTIALTCLILVHRRRFVSTRRSLTCAQ